MSIPGFAPDMAEPESATELKIAPQCEWRFEVPFKTVLYLKVTEGVGEIFGAELPVGVEMRFSGVKYALYAPLAPGCTIQYRLGANRENVNVTSELPEINEYISEESAMGGYANLHFALELLRLDAGTADDKKGPRVLLVGGKQSGKTSLAKILVLYAVKMDRLPLLVNLSPQDGVFSVPGSLTATPINDSLDLESAGGWGGSTTLGATFHNPKQPVVRNFGFTDISENLDLYKYQVSQLGVVSLSRMANDAAVRTSGMVIDTPPLLINDVTIVENIVADFEVDLVVVVGNERFTVDLRRKFSHRISKGALTVVKVAASGGVAELSDAYLRKAQEDTIKQYFNGDSRTPLSPFKTEVDVRLFTIYKVVKLLEFQSQNAFLPSGDDFTAEESEEAEKRKDDRSLDMYFQKLDEPSSSNLENSILAVTNLPVTGSGKFLPRDLLNASVLGYANVSRVDDTKKRMSLLLPFPGQLPPNVLIATDVGYME